MHCDPAFFMPGCARVVFDIARTMVPTPDIDDDRGVVARCHGRRSPFNGRRLWKSG